MQSHYMDKANIQSPNNSTEKLEWTKPVLEEFSITSATRNAGIINLDADHALDIS